MENLVFSLNAVVPVFLLMLLGVLFRNMGLLDEHVTGKLNQFVFKAALPVLLFRDLSGENFYEAWNGKFVLFCFLVTGISILISVFLSFLWKDRKIQGEFVQASYRSSAALLGIAFIQNIYGTSGMAPLMIIGTVPLYNVAAVAVLSLLCPQRGKPNRRLMPDTAKGIVTNPIIIGIAAGLVWSLLKLPQPVIMQKTVNSISALATPLGLMAMGAGFEYRKAFAKIKPAVVCSIMKLIVFCAVFLPAAVRLGYRNEELVAILVMLGSASTVSCYIMAKNMGHDGVLSSSVVMITTFFSAFTLTGWLYLLKMLALI